MIVKCRFDSRRDAAIDLPCLLLLVTVFVVALTSSVNAEPDGISSSYDLGSSPGPVSPKVEHHLPDDEKGSKNLTSINTEGGVISMAKTTQHLNVESTAVTQLYKLDEPGTRENVPKERNASPSIVARKGVREKIKGRKGVSEQDVNPDRTDTQSFNQTNFTNAKPVMETKPTLQTACTDNQSASSTVATSRLNDTVPQASKKNSNHSTNSTDLAPPNVVRTEAANNATQPKVSTHVEKHIPKPKPTVTSVDGPEVDDYKPPSHTKSSPLGMPRKIDYIMPVVITIFALPLLGTAIFILYRRGRDCWDKRHYRRMDFLIDGMYND